MEIKVETWKIVEEAPHYAISNLGRVKSLARAKRHVAKSTGKESSLLLKEKILKPQKDALGYLHYRLLTSNGTYILRKGHTLVAKAFLGYVPTFHGGKRYKERFK